MRRILLADDEPHTLERIRKYLVGLGFEVDCAGNGEAALEILLASPGYYDLVCTDAMMPKMDGFELFWNIRSNALFTALPVVFLGSAPNGWDEYMQAKKDRYLRTGQHDAVVYKPSSFGDWGRPWVEAVGDAVRELLSKEEIPLILCP